MERSSSGAGAGAGGGSVSAAPSASMTSRSSLPISPPTSSSSSGMEHVLCFQKEVLALEHFDVDRFVSDCRSRSTLDTLKADLTRYSHTLESRVVELINKGYADFVSLSSNLSGMDKTIDALRQPLVQTREEVMQVRERVKQAHEAIAKHLEEWRQIRCTKEQLQLMVSTHDTLVRVERLLGADQDQEGSGNAVSIGDEEESLLDKSRAIQRVTNHYNQLRFFVKQADGLAFTQMLGPRISVVERSIGDRLRLLFETSLKKEDEALIVDCLRIFDAVDQCHTAEEVFKNAVVVPALSKIITLKAVEGGKRNSCDGLPSVFNDVVSFARSPLMSLVVSRSQSCGFGFDFVSNSLMPALAAEIQNSVPLVYAPGIPELFHRNYRLLEDMLQQIESHGCKSTESVRRFREGDGMRSLRKRWNMSIYYSIRHRAIVQEIQPHMTGRPRPVDEGEASRFILHQPHAISLALQKCFDPSIFLDRVAPSLFKLTLHLLRGFSNWVMQSADDAKSSVALSSGFFTSVEHFCLTLASDVETMIEWVRLHLVPSIEAVCGDMNPAAVHLMCETLLNCGEGGGIGEEDVTSLVGDALAHVGRGLCEVAVTESIAGLQAMRGIMQTYRMTGKDRPSRPSFYVQSVTSPLEKLVKCEDSKLHLSLRTKKTWATFAADKVATRFCEMTRDLLETVEQQSKMLKKISRAAVPSGDASGLSDDDKILLQLHLDIARFGDSMREAGVDIDALPSYVSLREYTERAKDL